MNGEWQTKILGDVCERVTVGHVGITSPYYRDQGILFLRTQNVGVSGLVLDDRKYVTPEFHKSLKKSEVKPGDVLMSRVITHTVHCALVPPDLGPANCANVILVRPAAGLLAEFLVHYIRSSDAQRHLLDRKVGSAQLVVNTGVVQSWPIPVPPLREQQRIVDILDEAFEGIATAKANAEKNVQNARVLFESYLECVLAQRGTGWAEKPFSELCDIKHGYAFDGEFFASEGDYVLMTPGNFYEKGGYRDRGDKQKYYTGQIPSDYVLSKGDLLVAMTEQAAGLLGSPIIVPESDKFLHNQRLGLVTKKPGVPWTNEFFFHVFNTKAVRNEIHASASGIKVRHTSPTKIGEVVVAFPTSIPEQREIVSIFAKLDKETQRLESLYQQKVAALAALKKSLLHQAFTGNL